MSVSEQMAEMARRALKIRDGLVAVSEWEREHGPFSDAELDAARRSVRMGASGYEDPDR